MKNIFAGLSVLIYACLYWTGCSSPSALPARNPATDRDPLQIHFMDIAYGEKNLHLRVGVQNPATEPVGDILYVHGFADRLDNHGPLFKTWTRAGFRVIAFDLPSHGENSGSYNDLNHFDFEDLGELVVKVEQATKSADETRPLILSGWSTGGLIVTRMIQTGWTNGLSRRVSGAILFAPGVSVRKFPWTFGNRMGQVTSSTLTHDPNPPHFGTILFDSPFWSKFIKSFTLKLSANSLASFLEDYPSDVRTLVFSGGDSEDMYAKSKGIREWVKLKNAFHGHHEPSVMSIVCPHAMHELDNELPRFGAIEVRNLAAQFAEDLALNAEISLSTPTICKRD